MTAEMILRTADRRMWRLHLPAIGLLLLVFLSTDPKVTGIGVLCAITAAAWVVICLADWLSAERRANRAGH